MNESYIPTPITNAAEEEVLTRYLKTHGEKRDLIRAMDEAATGWKLARQLERKLYTATKDKP